MARSTQLYQIKATRLHTYCMCLLSDPACVYYQILHVFTIRSFQDRDNRLPVSAIPARVLSSWAAPSCVCAGTQSCRPSTVCRTCTHAMQCGQQSCHPSTVCRNCAHAVQCGQTLPILDAAKPFQYSAVKPFQYWILDVFWQGPPAPKVRVPIIIAKRRLKSGWYAISNPDDAILNKRGGMV